jgi:hypothetical protein
MDMALQQKRYSSGEIEDINAVRRYCQVITASDIAEPNGRKIRRSIWNVSEVPNADDFNTAMFNQAKPNRTALNTWKRFLLTVADPARNLYQPLGVWFCEYTECRRRPTWVYQEATGELYYRVGPRTEYIRCEKVGGGYHRVPDAGEQETVTPPQGALPAVVRTRGQELQVLTQLSYVAPSVVAPTTFQQYVESLEPWEYQLLRSIQLHIPPTAIMDYINNHEELYVASDGSVQEKSRATFGLLIDKPNSIGRLAEGYGQVPGIQISSFRAEAYGILATGRLIKHLATYTNTQVRTRIIHWVDNQSVIQRIQTLAKKKIATPTETLLPDWDVVQEAANTINQLGLEQYELKWVKSHQDVGKPYNDLPREAQLNCDADRLATEAYTNEGIQYARPRVPMMPATYAQLEIGGCTITSHYKTNIRETATFPAYKEYLMKKFAWTKETYEKVDWEVFRITTAPYDEHRPTLVKHLHGIAPTGK